MILRCAVVDRDHVTVVVRGFKTVEESLTLRSDYSSNCPEAFLTDNQGNRHPVSPELLRSLKPEIALWLDGILPKRIQEFASQVGAHVRVTKDQDDALLLMSLYQKIH
jgi:hypothetical protein